MPKAVEAASATLLVILLSAVGRFDGPPCLHIAASEPKLCLGSDQHSHRLDTTAVVAHALVVAHVKPLSSESASAPVASMQCEVTWSAPQPSLQSTE